MSSVLSVRQRSKPRRMRPSHQTHNLQEPHHQQCQVPPQIEGQQKQLRPSPALRSDSEPVFRSGRSTPLPAYNPPRNPITGSTFSNTAVRKETGPLLDAPQKDTPRSAPKTGAPKTVTLHYTNPDNFATSNLNLPTTTDTYIAELFDQGCKKLNLEKQSTS